MLAGIPTHLPPGWRPTITLRPHVDSRGMMPHHLRERLWLYDPSGTLDIRDINKIPADIKRWELEPAFDGGSVCCP